MMFLSTAAVSVTPLAGVWIEIPSQSHRRVRNVVTPLAGVWIEILMLFGQISLSIVTPLAGVWIEIGHPV